ncbi:pyridoxamine 5'-phosphate oxidase family protein [Luteimonas sp. e5]
MSHHQDSQDHQEQRKTLGKLIDSFGVAMLTSVDADGRLASRPMTPLGDEFDGGFWFVTEADNPLIAQIKAQPAVNVGFMHEGDNHYVSVAGRAGSVEDREQLRRLWNTALDAFFKDGPDDPRITLLRVEADEAAYWDGPGNLLTKLAYFATVATTGDHEALSETGQVKL